MDPIVGLVVIILAVWGARAGAPTGWAKAKDVRRKSIDNWHSSHPDAPASARFGAQLGALRAFLKDGLPWFFRGLKQAYLDAKEEAERKYRPNQPAPGNPEPPKPESKKSGVECPTCHRPLQPSTRHDGKFKPCEFCKPPKKPDPGNGGSTGNGNGSAGPDKPGAAGGDQGPFHWKCPRCDQTSPFAFHSPDEAAEDAKTHKCPKRETDQDGGDTMDKKYIEVHTCWDLQAAMTEKVDDAVAELQDAKADEKRATDDMAHMERTKAALENAGVPDNQIGEFIKLIEADRQRVAAAQSRVRAADAEVAAANAALEMANRHCALAGTAAGAFYGRKEHAGRS